MRIEVIAWLLYSLDLNPIKNLWKMLKAEIDRAHLKCCMEMRLCKYNMIHKGRRGRKPGYIHEMGSHDLKSCAVKCQRNIKLKSMGNS